jgi:hypothetical protein
MFQINKNPSINQLRQFIIIGMVVGLMCGYLSYKANPNLARVVWTCTTIIFGASLFFPKAVKPLFLLSMYLSFPLGYCISYVLLAIIFFFVVTPLGLIMRVYGRDPLRRKFDPSVKSYWLGRQRRDDMAQHFKQY